MLFAHCSQRSALESIVRLRVEHVCARQKHGIGLFVKQELHRSRPDGWRTSLSSSDRGYIPSPERRRNLGRTSACHQALFTRDGSIFPRNFASQTGEVSVKP